MPTTREISAYCAWCGKHQSGPKLRAGRKTPGVSHTICAKCKQKMIAPHRENPSLMILNPGPVSTQAAEDAWRDFHISEPGEIFEVDEADCPKGTPSPLMVIGRLESLIYRVPGESGKAGTPFEHEFSDFKNGAQCKHTRDVFCGCRPVLCADTQGRLFIIGGQYTIRREGIVG